ncbi:MAG TPA: Minf_1886 family protein [Urbifossiella sp.]|nr:Minf_1886 family protein [Urbifossiella sp.]
MDPKLMELTRCEPRYSYEAYQFVCDAVNFTQDRLGRVIDDDRLEVDQHVNGGELLRGACAFAVQEYGLMAPIVFKMWGIRTTDDFGEMVFRLIEAEKLSKSDRDDPEDFRGLFNLEQALADEFDQVMGAAPRRSER